MSRFVFSADSHVGEPKDLYLNGLPPSLQAHVLHTERKDGFYLVKRGEDILIRQKLGDGVAGSKRMGANDIALRLQDMAADGIDAEIIFPTLALMTYTIAHPEAELATARLYNDWLQSHFADHLHIFVPAAILPVRDLNETLNELKRIAALGFTAAMLPVVTPAGVVPYNDARWDPIFAFAGEQAIPLVFHSGTGQADVVRERGPGGAVYNYTYQLADAMNTITLLVSGGVLDRNPQTHVVTVECGASWLAALAERMDEVYFAHAVYVKPKLSVKPSDVVRRQVHCAFQYDRAGIMARDVTGTAALLWGADYPHLEGTFPNSREVIGKLFDGIDISEQEQADILGGTARRLFRLRDKV